MVIAELDSAILGCQIHVYMTKVWLKVARTAFIAKHKGSFLFQHRKLTAGFFCVLSTARRFR